MIVYAEMHNYSIKNVLETAENSEEGEQYRLIHKNVIYMLMAYDV